MKIAEFRKGFLILPGLLLSCLLALGLAAQDQGYPQDQGPPPDQGYPQDQANAQDQNGNPPGVAARISELQGNVSIEPSGQDQWTQASLNYTMTTGDRIYTDQGANAELEVGPYTVRVGENTDLTIANLDDQLMQLGVAQGTARVGVYDLPQGDAVEIDTPNGALNALGPGSYRVDVNPNGGSRVIVENGSLQVSGGNLNQTIAGGQAVYLSGTNPIQMTSIGYPGPDGFDNWYDSRDHQFQGYRDRDRAYVDPDMPGAADLDQYGTWQAQSQYGPVWYPSNEPADWVPYRQGHWAYVQPWGWTWVDDEPWGYAPFHYGRWAQIGARWGWIPGPVDVQPVYAPALVAFVGGGGFSMSIGIGGGGGGLAAWFPLGPSDPYIPWYHYQGDYLRQVNVTNVRNVTNITNITNIVNRTNVTNINTANIHYAYRTVAATAVPVAAFSGGQPVARAVVHVTPAQLAQARVITRPAVTPARTAIFAGRAAVKAPPVRNAKFVVPPHGRAAQAAARGGVAAPARRPAAARSTMPGARPTPARPTPGAASRTMPGARPTPTRPEARPTPTRPTRGAAPRSVPGARPTPTRPEGRPTPTRPTPGAASRTVPRARPTPTRPAARTAPARTTPTRPEARPSPARPSQHVTRPEARPAHPEARPAPATRPEARRATPARKAAPSKTRPEEKTKQEQKQP